MKHALLFLSAIAGAASASDMETCLADRGYKHVEHIVPEQLSMSVDHGSHIQLRAREDVDQAYSERVAGGVVYYGVDDTGDWDDDKWLEFSGIVDEFASGIRDCVAAAPGLGVRGDMVKTMGFALGLVVLWLI